MSKRSESLKEHYRKNPRGSKYATKRDWLAAKKYFRLLNRYGITRKFYELMIHQQNGLCAICDKEFQVVDHSHKTEEIRGLLCNNCNWGLGNFMDNPENLIRAAQYLQSESQHSLKSIKYQFDSEGLIYAEAR